jgi:putative tryptophan/tyrosine transport system substrate-binding protein
VYIGPTTVRRIGILSEAPSVWWGVFRDGRRQLGYAEGKNLLVEYRRVQSDRDLCAAYTRELVALGVECIVTCGKPAD